MCFKCPQICERENDDSRVVIPGINKSVDDKGVHRKFSKIELGQVGLHERNGHVCNCTNVGFKAQQKLDIKPKLQIFQQ